MTDDEHIKPLQACIRLIDRFEPQLPDKASDETGVQELLAYSRALSFGRITLQVMIQTLPNERFAVTLPTIVRPYFELSAQICWASNDSDRWFRLWVSWLKANTTVLRETIEFLPGLKDAASKHLPSHEERLRNLDPDGAVKGAPKMQQVLREIGVATAATSTKTRTMGDYLYTIFWRTASATAHGHISGIGSSAAFLSHVSVSGAIMATHFLLRELPNWLFDEEAAVERLRSELESSILEILHSVPIFRNRRETRHDR